ncbi:unnamed protein product, partial [Laminaria digitata]
MAAVLFHRHKNGTEKRREQTSQKAWAINPQPPRQLTWRMPAQIHTLYKISLRRGVRSDYFQTKTIKKALTPAGETGETHRKSLITVQGALP